MKGTNNGLRRLYSRKRRRRKKKVYERDNGCCFWCRKPLPLKGSTVDHIIPESVGGDNSVGNLVLACRPCNQARGAMDASEYLLSKFVTLH